MNTYRLQIYHARKWKWGLHDYTLEQAVRRVEELEQVGIKARVKPFVEMVG